MRHSINFYIKKNKSGFTLIEILVVVAIIGILVAIVTLNFNDARKKSRDEIRKNELKTLQLAIETYKIQNGEYPASGCGQSARRWSGPGPQGSWGTACEDYIVGLVPNYIKELPKDPNQEYVDSKGFIYSTNADRSGYKLLSNYSVEVNFVTSYADEFARCPRACDVCASAGLQRDVYAVYGGGDSAECW